MTILISAANSDISDSLCRIYKEVFPDERIVGIAPDGIWPASVIFDKVYEIGTVQDPNYLTTLWDVFKKEKISIFVPVSEHELRFLLQKKVQWPEGIKVLINPSQVLLPCLNKQETVKWLHEMGVKCPKTLPLNQVQSSDLPVFIKPKESAGSKNSYAVHTWDFYLGLLKELDHLGIKQDSMIAQEYLVDSEQEYTCAISKINGTSHYLVLRRKLIAGITGRATISSNPKILETLKKISAHVSEDFFINVQLRLIDNVPMVFEINPRFSSTVMFRHMIGFRDFFWHVDCLKGNFNPVVASIPHKEMYRIFREIVV